MVKTSLVRRAEIVEEWMHPIEGKFGQIFYDKSASNNILIENSLSQESNTSSGS